MMPEKIWARRQGNQLQPLDGRVWRPDSQVAALSSGTKYIRADIAEASNKILREALEKLLGCDWMIEGVYRSQYETVANEAREALNKEKES